jgi:hypothetical protein
MAPGKSELAALLVHLDRTRSALNQHHDELVRHGGALDNPERLAFLALEAAAWYNALEDLFVAVARAFEETPATGDAWHSELLKRMTMQLPYVRPCIVASAQEPHLRTLLKFRHFLRHAYAVKLDATKIAAIVRALTTAHDGVLASIESARDAIDAAVRAD